METNSIRNQMNNNHRQTEFNRCKHACGHAKQAKTQAHKNKEKVLAFDRKLSLDWFGYFSIF